MTDDDCGSVDDDDDDETECNSQADTVTGVDCVASSYEAPSRVALVWSVSDASQCGSEVACDLRAPTELPTVSDDEEGEDTCFEELMFTFNTGVDNKSGKSNGLGYDSVTQALSARPSNITHDEPQLQVRMHCTLRDSSMHSRMRRTCLFSWIKRRALYSRN